jgi:hypothetical protein
MFKIIQSVILFLTSIVLILIVLKIAEDREAKRFDLQQEAWKQEGYNISK